MSKVHAQMARTLPLYFLVAFETVQISISQNVSYNAFSNNLKMCVSALYYYSIGKKMFIISSTKIQKRFENYSQKCIFVVSFF